MALHVVSVNGNTNVDQYYIPANWALIHAVRTFPIATTGLSPLFQGLPIHYSNGQFFQEILCDKIFPNSIEISSTTSGTIESMSLVGATEYTVEISAGAGGFNYSISDDAGHTLSYTDAGLSGAYTSNGGVIRAYMTCTFDDDYVVPPTYTFTSITGNGKPGTAGIVTGTGMDDVTDLMLKVGTTNINGLDVVALSPLSLGAATNTTLDFTFSSYTEFASGDSILFPTIIGYASTGDVYNTAQPSGIESNTGLSVNLKQVTYSSITGNGEPGTTGTIEGVNLDDTGELWLIKTGVSISPGTYEIQVKLTKTATSSTEISYTVDSSYYKIGGASIPIDFNYVTSLLSEISLYNLSDHAGPIDTGLSISFPSSTDPVCAPDLQECQFCDEIYTFRGFVYENTDELEKGGNFVVGGEKYDNQSMWLCSDDCLTVGSHCVILRTRDSRYFLTKCARINYTKIPVNCKDIWAKVLHWLDYGEAGNQNISNQLDPVSVAQVVNDTTTSEGLVSTQIGEITLPNAYNSVIPAGTEVVIYNTNKGGDFAKILGPTAQV